jgi:hypothetical protein
MKKLFVIWLTGVLGLSTTSLLEGAPAAVNQPAPITQVPAPTPYAITTKDGNSQIWQRMIYEKSPSGQIVPKIHSYTELASGLNHLVNGQWVESKEWIDILPNGTAAATNGQHQAYFPGDIYNGAIELVTPDGEQLISRPMGLSYFDGTNSVLIAELTNSIGVVVGSNQVVYPDAFIDFKADLRYTYTKAGFEQDIILRESPLTPESYGLNPATARLQVLTEFFDPPQPAMTVSTLPEQAGVTLTDDTLDFGAMEMVPGRAFLLGADATEAPASVSKKWLLLDGRQFLVEEVPVEALANALAALPAAQQVSANVGTNPSKRVASKKLPLPAQHLAKDGTTGQMMRLAKAAEPMTGVVLDYQTVSSTVTNFIFQSDMTYYISSGVTLKGNNNIFEGGTVLKYSTNGQISLGNLVTLKSQAAAYRPVVLTAKDDDSVGEVISGSTGSPSGYYGAASGYVNLSGGGGPYFSLSNFRIAYANIGIKNTSGNSLPTFYDGQFINCSFAVNDNGGGSSSGVSFRNILLANVQTNYINPSPHSPLFVDFQNVTFFNVINISDVHTSSSDRFYFTNCIFANVTTATNAGSYKLNAGYNGFYNSPVFGANTFTNAAYPFQTVGAGSYYLTNGSGFRDVGANSLDPVLSAELQLKTTYPPIVYSNVTISVVTTLSPQATRDTNNAPDLGYHYDPLDYVFGGCDLFTNLTLTAGTAVGWFEGYGSVSSSGQPYGLSLNNGANFTSTGTATQPCLVVRHDTVQEGGNGNWNGRGYMGGLMINGSGANPIPQINAQFTKWINTPSMANLFRDNWAYGVVSASGCEFYGGMSSYRPSCYYTNCLFFRPGIFFWDQMDAASFTFQNCTFYNGCLAMSRVTGQSFSFWTVKNTAFDGTAFAWGDNFNGDTNHTAFDYNTYNTNNISWQTYPYPYPPTYGTLEVVGVHDLNVTNYNWQSSWLGNFYLPTASPLINVGSTTADQVGLYHYTTQTNQTKEANSVVDIGYHYVALDGSGNPIDSNGDGIPDYLADVNGNGYGDTGETNWGIIMLTQPVSQTIIQTSNVTFSVTAGGLAPFSYQWYFNATAIANATNSTLTILDVLTNDAGPYHVVASNYTGSVTGSNATLTVLVVPTISMTSPDNNRVFIASQTNIALAAVAADMAGTITQVQFFQGTTSLGTVTTPPYNLTWSNANAGTYALTAQAMDNLGLVATSAVVNIVVEPLFTTNYLALWLKADAITGLTNNAPINNWPDSSGWNQSVSSTHATEPTFVTNIINGYPIVRFDASLGQCFALPDGLFNGTTGTEGIVILKVKVAKPTQARPLWYWGSHDPALGYPDMSGNIVDGFGGSTLYTVGNPAQPLDQFHVYEVAAKTGSWSAWINSELEANMTKNSYIVTSNNYALGGSGRYTFDGDMAEVLVFSRTLTVGERDAVNSYVNLKYGFVTTPAAPTNLMATTISPTQVGLTWSFALTNTSTVFKIERMTTLGGFYAPFATVRDATSYVDTNLLIRTTYHYRIKASNAAGDSGYSNEAQATTQTNGTDIPFTNLTLWLKADAGMVLQSTNGTVKTWFDQSGNYNDGNQTTATNRPSWLGGPLGGHPVVRFNATNGQYLTLPSLVLTNVTGAEALVVLKAAVAVPSARRQLWQMGSSGSSSLAYPDYSGDIVDDFASTSTRAITPPQPLDQYRIFNVAGQDGYWATWINSQSLGTDNNTFGISTNMILGGGTNAYFDGDIAEVLIFNRVLTADERNTANNYLVNKYQYLTPTNVLVTAQSATQLSVSWADVASFKAQTYNIDRKIGSGGTYSQIATVQNAYSFLDTNTVADTNYYYRVRVTNYFGQYISSEVAPPIVDVTNPPPGGVYASQGVPLGASAADSDGTITQVQFMVAHNNLGAATVVAGTTNSPYNLIWTNSFQPGGYSLMARAFDNGGNSRISNPVTITTQLDSNGDGIPDYLQVSQGNDPLNPWVPPSANTNDHTAPVITLLIPTNAVIVP